MRTKTFHVLYFVRAASPYLWGFAAAAALDSAIDIRTLFLPVMAGIVMLSAASVILWRAGR